MSTNKTEGACVFCQKRFTRGGMSRHLRACPERKAAIARANARPGKSETLIHLLAHDAWGGSFWLHLEMRGAEPLDELDTYLRAIWLECCGHLSEFTRGGWGTPKVAMRRLAQDVLVPGTELTHIYDFGTESVTIIRAVEVRTGKPLEKKPLLLMARNEMAFGSCAECDQPATRLCLECAQTGEHAVLCDAHAATHPHDEYDEPVPLVNSPRLGLCGYTGPAVAPY